MGSPGREDSRQGGGWQTQRGGGWQTLWPHIREQINREEWWESKADHTTQGSSSGK